MKVTITRAQYEEIKKIINKHYEGCIRCEEDDSAKEAVLDYLSYVTNDIEDILVDDTKKDSE
jgi:hypothetical protein